MDLGMIGLGNMGASMTSRLLARGHRVVGYDTDREAIETVIREGASGASSLPKLFGKLEGRRVTCLMVPAVDLLVRASEERPELEEIRGWVDDGGTGRWTVEEAVDRAVPVPIIAASLFARFSSRREHGFSDKVIAALRNQLGGHALPRAQ